LPVSVLVAVTATPGRGTPPGLPTVPAMIVPRIVPPCGAGVAGSVAAGELEVCGSVAGGTGCVAGAEGAAVCVAAGAGVGVCAPIGTSPAMHKTTLHLLGLNLTQPSLQKSVRTHLYFT
jgi:hypothetical protein